MQEFTKQDIANALARIQMPITSKTWGICSNYLHQYNTEIDYFDNKVVDAILRIVMIQACAELDMYSGDSSYPILPSKFITPDTVSRSLKAETLFDNYCGVNKWNKTTLYGRARCQVYNLMVKKLKRMYLAEITNL